jgi:hypothetical protein
MQRVIFYDTELCLELNISIQIKYIKIYKIYLRLLKNILYKYADFVLMVLNYWKMYEKLF